MESIKKAICLILTLGLNSSNAHALIKDGSFVNKLDHHAHAFIKTINGATYGVILQMNATNDGVGIYTVEERGLDGTLEWTPIESRDSKSLQSGEKPEFTANIIQQKGEKYIQFSRTKDGAQWLFEECEQLAWVPLPDQEVTFKTEDASRELRKLNTASSRKAHVSGTFLAGEKYFHGTYLVRSPIPGLGELHAVESNPERPSGAQVSELITGFMLQISKNNKKFLLFFNLHSTVKTFKVLN